MGERPDGKLHSGWAAFWRNGGVPAAIALASILVTRNTQLAGLMRYQRQEVLNGQWWRLLSCHLVHLDSVHLATNIAALFVMSAIFADTLRAGTQLLALLFAGMVVGLALLACEPQVSYYAGLSGALHGLLAVGALVWVRDRPRLGGLLVAGMLCKLLIEYGGYAFWFTVRTFPVVTSAHRWGAAGGLVFGLALVTHHPHASAKNEDA
jgi:rhomboid family GlyGly-CTERM serine protease